VVPDTKVEPGGDLGGDETGPQRSALRATASVRQAVNRVLKQEG
jgi:hypothetical protein